MNSGITAIGTAMDGTFILYEDTGLVQFVKNESMDNFLYANNIHDPSHIKHDSIQIPAEYKCWMLHDSISHSYRKKAPVPVCTYITEEDGQKTRTQLFSAEIGCTGIHILCHTKEKIEIWDARHDANSSGHSSLLFFLWTETDGHPVDIHTAKKLKLTKAFGFGSDYVSKMQPWGITVPEILYWNIRKCQTPDEMTSILKESMPYEFITNRPNTRIADLDCILPDREWDPLDKPDNGLAASV